MILFYAHHFKFYATFKCTSNNAEDVNTIYLNKTDTLFDQLNVIFSTKVEYHKIYHVGKNKQAYAGKT